MSGFLKYSSITRKIIMGLSGLFLITFILVHLMVNGFSLISADLFNAGSHFMGTNPVIQAMQFVLAAGFVIHIGMGIMLTLQNNAARPTKYAYNNASANSTLSSRYMIYSGLLVMVFIFIHMKDFFVPIKFGPHDFGTDFDLLTKVFSNPIYVGVYVLAFIALAIHLHHGFQSSFQSIGANHTKYTPTIKKLGLLFCWVVGIGFSAIALFHYFNSL